MVLIRIKLDFEYVLDDSCGDNFYSSTGVLESPVSEDGKYPSRALCKWNITVPNGLVQVAMTHLDVEYQQDCQWDSLQVMSFYKLLSSRTFYLFLVTSIYFWPILFILKNFCFTCGTLSWHI